MVGSWLFLFLSLLLLSSPLPTWPALPSTFGVPPAFVSRYVPRSGDTFRCLDGSKSISWSAVNDDYCDCPDGSDEPGTSACAQGTFYCANKGHIGAQISSTRVHDGLCEPECCDGSDEPAGVCPDRCVEVGAAHRANLDAERKLRKTGSKIRLTYIAFAHKEKKRLEEEIVSLTREIADREREVARLKDIAERAESLSAADLEHKKASPLFTTLTAHVVAIKSLRREYKKHREREQLLESILETLSNGYNPNYQDMAVLEAVRGWQQLSGTGKVESTEVSEDATPKEEEIEVGLWTANEIERDLDGLLETDYVSLLLAHEEHIRSPPESPLLNLPSYLPEATLAKYESFKSTILSWMQTLGILKGVVDSPAEAARAQQAFHEAERSLNLSVEEKSKAVEELADLFSAEGFGLEGEWKKLEGTCLELDTGEYIYEVCLFNEAKQRPKSGGSSFSLGRFQEWNVSATPGTAEYYTKQAYTGGARCWNGPERSVSLVMSCGTQNQLTSAVELEKCEYQITGMTPALCLPLDENEGISRDDSEL